MSARHPASRLAHAHLNAFQSFVREYAPKHALKQFSQYLSKQSLDVLSANAIHFTIQPSHEFTTSSLGSRAQQAKRQLDVCLATLSDIAGQKLRNKAVVAHPLGVLASNALRGARHVRFLNKTNGIIPPAKSAQHQPFSAPAAFDNADLLLLEPRAVTPQGIVAEQGSRLLVELASARGVPVYALSTSLHVTPRWKNVLGDEIIPGELLDGVISEHGIYAHDQFLARVQASFPWLFGWS